MIKSRVWCWYNSTWDHSLSQERALLILQSYLHSKCPPWVSHVPCCILQLFSDGVELHHRRIQHIRHILDLSHHLPPAAFLQLARVFDEVLVHPSEEALHRSYGPVRDLCGSQHGRVHQADDLDGPANLPVLRVVLGARPEERVAAELVQALIDEVEDLPQVQQVTFVLLQRYLHLVVRNITSLG